MARDIFERFRKRSRQFEATRGRPIAPSVSRRFLEAEISSEAERVGVEAERAERITNLQESRRIREEELEASKRANIASGAIGLVEAGATLSDTSLGRKISGAAKRVAPSIFDAPAAAGIVTPILSTAATDIGALTGGKFATPLTGTATATGVAPTLTGTALSVALPAVVGGFVGSKISEGVGGEGKGARNTGRVVGSGTAGFISGGPVGAVIGAVIGGIQSETVICTELNRQGYLADNVLKLDGEYRLANLSVKIYKGYMRWAPYVVRAMQKSRVITWIVKPFGLGWAHHTAHQINKNITGSWLGWTLLKFGSPLCWLIGGK